MNFQPHGHTSKRVPYLLQCGLPGAVAGVLTFGFLLLDYHYLPERPFFGVPLEGVGGVVLLALAMARALFLRSRTPDTHRLTVRESIGCGLFTAICMGLLWAALSVVYMQFHPQYRLDMIREASRHIPRGATAAESVGAHLAASAQYEPLILIPVTLLASIIMGLFFTVLLRFAVNIFTGPIAHSRS